MDGSNATIDIDYIEVPQPTSNVVKFPEGFPTVSGQPSGNVSYTSQQLAEVAGVSRQAWGKDWYRYFPLVVSETKLKQGRKYTQLCYELTESLAEAKGEGRTPIDWLENVARPTWGELLEDLRFEAERQGAIVPAALTAASDARGLALTQAQSLQGFAGALLEQVGKHLAANSATATAEQEAIAEAAIVASEMAAILKEQQLRAKVRADFEAQQSAAAATSLEQKLSDLRGGVQ
ncbi:MAG: hypothetical protein HC771_19160 [Synechococcales cyanobacterium CRU_2_2]|nr:hypothetical protein [Synechococcales cyanobacterium CRU_2_2]